MQDARRYGASRGSDRRRDMDRADRAARAAFFVIAGALALSATTSSSAGAQEQREREHRISPPRIQPSPRAENRTRVGFAAEAAPRNDRPFRQPRYLPQLVYYPVPVGWGYGYGNNYGVGYGAGYGYAPPVDYPGVVDANGRPLYSESRDAATLGSYGPVGTPDLTGSPYSVVDGGAMVVDFGNGDRRTVQSCVADEAQRAPNGQPRTIFYSGPADGVILRAGQSGRVQGTPPAGASVCYGLDFSGRIALSY